ncbi:hypothetical protein CMV_014758 [Castanea mollissima]|uniref:Uncharacterized protein n=1 Tax=Castanea mollissima TaxID=60419 RepID=A0A8J4VKR0_9ROSI|nr:hypothetical protein CMV_014758 [Castanea mollissima]
MQLYSGVPKAVPIPNAGNGHPLIIEMEKKDKKKEWAKEKRLKNSIANTEKKRRVKAAADAAAEAKGKTDVKGKGRKKGKNNIALGTSTKLKALVYTVGGNTLTYSMGHLVSRATLSF